MPKLKIDGQEYEFEAGMSIIQVADMHGIEIPRFCYHEKLEIAGNCRMCLVEVKPGPPKPAASCAMPAADGQEVFTKTPMVKKAREGVMEFLLINHPLDCPICDQGGECDLQDQAYAYGSGNSRYDEHKRAVEDKYMGPLIKTHMTRCIHCTRCVRFAEDVAGVPEIGAIFRGEDMQITSYLEQAVHSELSGNVIDLCPVGALTSKPYAFHGRPWELKKTESIDVFDAVGSNIRIDSRGEAVLRVLPRLNEDVNEEWLSDKARFACDGLRNQRLDTPYVRNKGKLEPASWDDAFAVIAKKLKKLQGNQIAALAGNLADVEAMFALKSLMKQLGSPNIDCRLDGAAIDASERANYIMNTPIADLERADVVLLVGTNPRLEAPLVNTRLRKAVAKGNAVVYSIGEAAALTYPVHELGNDPILLNSLLDGSHDVAKALMNAQRPVIILGAGALAREDGASIHNAVRAIAENCNVIREDWNGLNMLHYAAARVGGLDIGFVPEKGGLDVVGMAQAIAENEVSFVYLLGADEIDMSMLGDAFVVYQGHHGDAGAHRADVILPAAAYTEKDAIYVNTEGRAQQTLRAIFPPNLAREDWKILRALSEVLGKPLPFDSHEALRHALFAQSPHLEQLGERAPASYKKLSKQSKTYRIRKEGFAPVIVNYYMTDPISRASKTMAQCSREIAGHGDNQEAA